MKFVAPLALTLLAQGTTAKRHKHRQLQTTARRSIGFATEECYDFHPEEGGFIYLPIQDDVNAYNVALGFPFTFNDGSTFTSVNINSNGHIYFGDYSRADSNSRYSFNGDFFTSSEHVIAPFWADVYSPDGGTIMYKSLGDKFVVIWEEVAGFTTGTNTFQVVISSDSTGDPQVCFCYEEMQWTGFGDTGISDGGSSGFMFASWDDTVDRNDWHGIGSANNGLAHLESHSYCFDADIVDAATPDTQIISTNDVTIPNYGGGNPESSGICYSAEVPQCQACSTYCSDNGFSSHLIVDNDICECHIPNTCPFPACDYAQVSDYSHMAFVGFERHYRYDIDLDGEYIQTDLNAERVYRIGSLRTYDTTTTAAFHDGDYCGAINAARSGSVIMNPTPSVTEPTLTSVSEPSVCNYEARFDVPCNNACEPTLTMAAIPLRRCESTTGGDLNGGGGSGSGGDPHVTTWVGEHFEYHGQCDLTLVKDANFADGLGLDIQIRTKLVRYWSYIKSVAIKIGNDILEIEGSADADDAEAHYWINFEYQGELDEAFAAGFSVTQELPSVYKRRYHIDLSPKYPDTTITVELYKEFVRVRFHGDHHAFGNTVGLMGDYKTGKTLARDGTTVLNDFTEFGDEWQVLPSEPKLFHEISHPQFPELCIKPEDPRGERQRRLAESTISIEQAEAACATLNDPLSIKDCVYDILATQDLDMVGAF
jgi:hypothetical protein